MVGERVRNVTDRTPIIRRVSNRISGGASRVRNTPGNKVLSRIPESEHRNFGNGTAVGLVEAGIAVILEETLGIPFGADAEVVDTEPDGDAMLYTVNVDAPTENISRARAFLDANTGFASILTDKMNVGNVEVVRTRPLRDTYQIQVRVED